MRGSMNKAYKIMIMTNTKNGLAVFDNRLAGKRSGVMLTLLVIGNVTYSFSIVH